MDSRESESHVAGGRLPEASPYDAVIKETQGDPVQSLFLVIALVELVSQFAPIFYRFRCYSLLSLLHPSPITLSSSIFSQPSPSHI